MKKTISIILCIFLLCSNFVLAEESQNITDKMNDIWLSTETDVHVLENIKKSNENKIEELINLYLIAPGYAREKIGISENDEKMKTQVNEIYAVKENEILKVYCMKNNEYAKQYADNKSFRYLISDDYSWFMKGESHYRRYDQEGDIYSDSDINTATYGSTVINDEGINFLKNNDNISNLLMDLSGEQINATKVIALDYVCTCLYIDTSEDEYLVCIYKGNYTNADDKKRYEWADNIELFKLYSAKEFIGIVAEDMNEMNSEKPVFETEALSLQKNGLLYGNENGLDLLKPLTRIEAATMLLRAMGESTPSDNTLQTFADVAPSHWGYGAAEKANSLGLIKGVGNDLFAPDDMVTGAQFATMVLRAGNHTDFNWEDALNILVDEEIISSQNADTMDFFTRGDMAKIIYESIEKGLF